MPPDNSSQSSRLIALDGLRAVAALVVIFAHASFAVAKTQWQAIALQHSALVPLLNATGAVHVFFVLSGYCLTASAQRGNNPADLAQFYVRRVARIHGPYVATVVIAWLARLWLYPEPVDGISPWMREHLAARLDGSELLAAFAFPGMAGGLLPQGWTLTVEMVFSLLLPAMVWIAARVHWGVLVIASAVLLAWSQPFDTPRYALDFSTGIALYLERARLTAFFARARGLAAAAGVLGLAVICYPPYTLLGARDPSLATAVFACGATLLVLGAAHAASLRRMLEWRPVAALGRVSYSIYLLHFTVLSVSTPLLAGGVGLPGGAAFALWVAAATSALSFLSYRGIELPCIRAGNAVCRWLAQRTGGTVRAARAA
jgi:peptidoglycan/LPS O-acetylase OafA/YrhL